MRQELLVTGAAGFIGSHLCKRLVAEPRRGTALAGIDLLSCDYGDAFDAATVDIRSVDALAESAGGREVSTLVHLAALAEVVIPFDALGELSATNVAGTVNVLAAYRPERMIFASSSAVYGNAGGEGASPTHEAMQVLGVYGVSKSFAELACEQWSRESGGISVALRLGNVVGPRCRGLIPYLVSHAVRHPDGRTPARLRGHGAIVRDYVPVEHVTDVILRSAELELAPGAFEVFNVGTGRGSTNREVATRVAEILDGEGYRLTLDFNDPTSPGESAAVVLNVATTRTRLELEPPSREDVEDSIDRAVHSWLTASAG